MRAAFRLTTCVAALALAGACSSREPSRADTPGGPTPAEMIAGADALDRRFVDAFNQDDADALMATYWNNPNLVSIGLDGSAPRGWDTTSAAWHASMDGNPESVLEYFESNNVPLGEVVIGWGQWKITTASDAGTPGVLQGNYSNVKGFRDGKWVILLDHASIPQP